MLCVRRVSGQPVLELGASEFEALTAVEGSVVRALKQRMGRELGVGTFRQTLVCDGRVLGDTDDLQLPMDLQLVLKSCVTSSSELRRIQNAAADNDADRLESFLCQGHDPAACYCRMDRMA